MITDEQRREVADELRRLTDGCHNSGVLDSEILGVLEVGCTDIPGCSDAYDVDVLADLIDRPIYRPVIPNAMEGYVFCPQCGAEIGEYGVPNYCHSCGVAILMNAKRNSRKGM